MKNFMYVSFEKNIDQPAICLRQTGISPNNRLRVEPGVTHHYYLLINAQSRTGDCAKKKKTLLPFGNKPTIFVLISI